MSSTDLATFLESLAREWQDGEVRPTHRERPGAARLKAKELVLGTLAKAAPARSTHEETTT